MAIAIIARDPTEVTAPASPCGACRQAILEFGPAASVIFTNSGRRLETKNIKALLPDSFSFIPR